MPVETRSQYYKNSAASRAEKAAAYKESLTKKWPSIPFCVSDFESFINGKDRGIFQIAFTCAYWHGKRIRYRANTIFVIDIVDVKMDTEQMNVKYKPWNKRLISGQNTAYTNDIPHLTMTFEEAINMLLEYSLTFGNGTLMSFCYENDMKIIKDTQTFLNNKNGTNINVFDDIRWNLLNQVCIRSMLSNDCPNYIKSFYTFAENEKFFTKCDYYMTKLETHNRFVRKDPEYEQFHDAMNDVFDALTVLQMAAKFDKCPILRDEDHLEEVVNVPCLNKERQLSAAEKTRKYADELQAKYDNMEI